MSRISNFFHVSQTTGTTGLTNAFGTARINNLALGTPTPATLANAQRWTGILDTVNVHVHAIAGGCTKLTVRVTSDADGNESLVPDTQATIAVGIGNANTGSVAFSAGVGMTNLNPTQTDCLVYIWVKTDAGTANLKECTLTWRE
jgi:hypothetical protein